MEPTVLTDKNIDQVIGEIEYELRDQNPNRKGISKYLVAVLLKAYKKLKNETSL